MGVPEEARDLIQRLLCPPETRLGRQGAADFQKHPFFLGLDWDGLRDSVPPFIPDFEGATDTCNFDVVEDGLTAMVSGGGVGTCGPCSAEGTPFACPSPTPCAVRAVTCPFETSDLW